MSKQPDRPLLTLDDVMPLKKQSRFDSVKSRRRMNHQPRIDLDLLGECRQSYINKDGFRRERARILRYLFGNQWGDIVNYHGVDMTEEEYIKLKKNIPLKTNVMVSLWMSVFGLHARQETEPVCYARHEDSKQLSDMMSAALQTNWQNTYMPDVLDVAFAEFLVSGAAFARESYEEREQLHDSYTDYINPYYMFWEAGSDPSHRDVRLIGCLRDFSPEELYFRFAKRAYGLTVEKLKELYHIGEDGKIARSANDFNDRNDFLNVSFERSSDASLCRVIEVWREEVKPRYQCKDPLAVRQTDAFFRVEKKDIGHVLKINQQRKALYEQQGVSVEKRAYITAEEIVDKYWQYYFMTPEGYILAEGETPYDYKSHPFSMTREQYANQSTEYDAVFVYDDRKGQRTGAKPEFYTHSAFNIGAHEMLQTQLNLIHEVSGVSGALQGKAPASGTSYARYQTEADNATTTIYPLIKRYTSFKERLAMKKCITIQQFYDEGRDITKRNSDSQTFYRRSSARNVQFDVSIKDSASSAAYQQLGNEFLDKLFDKGAIDPRTYIKHYDTPFADKLLVDYDAQMEQAQQQGIPLQVPGADQQLAAQATQALQGNGQLYTRQQPGQPLTPYRQQP